MSEYSYGRAADDAGGGAQKQLEIPRVGERAALARVRGSRLDEDNQEWDPRGIWKF